MTTVKRSLAASASGIAAVAPASSDLPMLRCLPLALAAALPAQGAILDMLDGETLYEGGFLLTLGHEIQSRTTLRYGSAPAANPQGLKELEQASTLALQWGLRHDLQVGVAISHARAEQDSAAGSVAAEGLGDLELLAKWRFLRLDARGRATNFALLSGLSLPTGEDDAVANGLELSPDLQPGSGGVDPMAGLAVTHEPGRWRFNLAAMHQWRTDTDHDGDRLGDETTFEAAIGNRFWLEPYPGPFMRLDLLLRHYRLGTDRQQGAVQPNTGSERWTWGLNWAFRPRPQLDFQVYFEKPFDQRVEGTQLGVDWQADLTIGYRF